MTTSVPTPNPYLSKSLFIRGLQCHKALWLHKYRPDLKDEVSPAQQAIFSAGTDVGILAQGLFPGGVEVPYEGLSPAEQLAMTREELAKGTTTIYEAAFSHDNVFVKVDILHRGKVGWELYEVKSSTGTKEVYLNDIALQYFVVTGTGLPVSKAALVHIDNSYVRQGTVDVPGLFTVVEVTDTVRQRQAEVVAELTAMRAMLYRDLPAIDIGPHCDDPYACPFTGHCWAHIPTPSVFDFADIGKPDAFDLYRRGIVRMADTPEAKLGWRQQLQLAGLLRQENRVETAAVSGFLEGLWYPLAYLDFETTYLTPVPLFDGTRPYQQVPFQFSLHWQECPDGPLHHVAYLAPAGADPQDGFLDALLAALPANACILTWNRGFEGKILTALAARNPERSTQINNLGDHLVDLMAPFRSKQIYHWGFNGSYSIKAVLPALVPELSYDGLTINNGELAAGTWLGLMETTDPQEQERLRRGLLEYCHLDTLAIVRILEKMREQVA
jgi:hypothetical protein